MNDKREFVLLGRHEEDVHVLTCRVRESNPEYVEILCDTMWAKRFDADNLPFFEQLAVPTRASQFIEWASERGLDPDGLLDEAREQSLAISLPPGSTDQTLDLLAPFIAVTVGEFVVGPGLLHTLRFGDGFEVTVTRDLRDLLSSGLTIGEWFRTHRRPTDAGDEQTRRDLLANLSLALHSGRASLLRKGSLWKRP